MAFSGQSFPALQFGSRFNKIKVTVNLPTAVVGNSAFEFRLLRYGFPRLAWEIPGRNLTWQDKETLLSFWNQMGGQLRSFLFTDPEHNTLTNYSFGAGTQINPPAAPALSTTSGTLASGTYTYAVTAYNAQGETTASPTAQRTLTSASGVTLNWAAVVSAIGYRVYGRVSGSLRLLADVGATLTYTDASATAVGVPAPSVNGTGTLQYPSLIPLAGLNHPLFHLAGLTLTPSNGTLQVVNGAPQITFTAGNAPMYGTNLVASGTYSLVARFDSTAGYALANAATPTVSAAIMDTIKLVEVFE